MSSGAKQALVIIGSAFLIMFLMPLSFVFSDWVACKVNGDCPYQVQCPKTPVFR